MGYSECHESSCEPQQQDCHESERCDMPEKFLDLADEAWMEVLKEKIKAQIESTCGNEMEQLAKVVTETNKERWNQKFAKRRLQHQYHERLKEIFMSKHA